MTRPPFVTDVHVADPPAGRTDAPVPDPGPGLGSGLGSGSPAGPPATSPVADPPPAEPPTVAYPAEPPTAGGPRIDVSGGVDTDLDGVPDTLALDDEDDLAFAVDTDRDGYADLVVRIGADAAARILPPDGIDIAAGLDDPLACYGEPLGPVDPSAW